MPSPWQIQSLRARIQALTSEISRVSAKDHPYPEPGIVFDALIEVIKARSKRFEDSYRLFGGRDDPIHTMALEETFGIVRKDLTRIAETFAIADRVDSPRIPFEMLRAFSWVANSMLPEESRTLLRLDSDFTYSVVSCLRRFEQYGWERQWHNAVVNSRRNLDRQNIELSDRDRPLTVLLLGAPSANASSVLIHALAAHELGHELIRHWESQFEDIREQAVQFVQTNHLPEIEDYIATNSYSLMRATSLPPKAAHTKTSDKVKVRLSRIAHYWLVELYSDLVATRLVGPAFLAAFHRILLDLTVATETHPPLFLRHRWVERYLESNFRSVFRDPVWAPWLSKSRPRGKHLTPQGREDDEALEPLFKIGERLCDHSFKRLSALAGQIPSPLDDSTLMKSITGMEDYIDNLAPPSAAFSFEVNETGGIGENASYLVWLLIYAVWRYRLNDERFSRFRSLHQWTALQAEEALDNLLLCSLQSIELRFRWSQIPISKRQPR